MNELDHVIALVHAGSRYMQSRANWFIAIELAWKISCLALTTLSYGQVTKLVDKSGGSATELVKLLGELGLKGAGVSEIFFKWAGNQQLVNDRIKTGNIAIGETNS